MISDNDTGVRRTTVLDLSDSEEQELLTGEGNTQSLLGGDFSKDKIVRGLFCGAMAALCGTSIYFAVQEVKDIENHRWKYTICMWSAGASSALFFHPIISPELRERIYRIMSAWVYECFFIGTQLYLNFFSEGTKRILHGGFVCSAGYFQARDLAILFSLRRSDYLRTLNYTNDEKKLIPMYPPNTRNRDFPKVYETGQLLLAISTTVLFFLLRDGHTDYLHRHGVYGNFSALYLGFRLGRIFTYFGDNFKEDYENEFRRSIETTVELPVGLKVGHMVKTGFSLASPLATAVLLQGLSRPHQYTVIDNPTNGIPDYLIMVLVGAILGSKMFLEKREMENPRSSFHITRRIIQERRASTASISTAEKVCKFTKDYFLTLLCIAGLDAYMTVVGLKSGEMRIINAIIILLFTSNFSFFAVNHLVKNFSPLMSSELSSLSTVEKMWNNRVTNELYLQCVKPTFLITCYQYLTTKFNLFDSYMDSAPPQLLNFSYAGWAFWGGVWGTLRALYVQEMEPHPFTSDLGAIEMLNTAVGGLMSPSG